MANLKKKGSITKNVYIKNNNNKTFGLPTCLPRRGQACELIDKPITIHLYKFPLGFLIRVREAGDQPYLGISDFKVVAILEATTTTI